MRKHEAGACRGGLSLPAAGRAFDLPWRAFQAPAPPPRMEVAPGEWPLAVAAALRRAVEVPVREHLAMNAAAGAAPRPPARALAKHHAHTHQAQLRQIDSLTSKEAASNL